MIIAFNWIGAAFVVAGGVVAYMLGRIHPPLDHGPFPYIVLSTVVAMDLAYRYFVVRPGVEYEPHENWITTGRGGSLMFLPAWVTGIGAMVLLRATLDAPV